MAYGLFGMQGKKLEHLSSQSCGKFYIYLISVTQSSKRLTSVSMLNSALSVAANNTLFVLSTIYCAKCNPTCYVLATPFIDKFRKCTIIATPNNFGPEGK